RCGANSKAKTITGKERWIGLDNPGAVGRKNDLTAGGTPNNIRWTPFLGHGCLPATDRVLAMPQDTESFFLPKPQPTQGPCPPETGKKRNGIGCVPFLPPSSPTIQRMASSCVSVRFTAQCEYFPNRRRSRNSSENIVGSLPRLRTRELRRRPRSERVAPRRAGA